MPAALIAALLTPAAATVTLAAAPAERRVLFHGSARVCGDPAFIPDAPARAFRGADGTVTLLAPHYLNWRMTGADLATLRPDCAPVMTPDDLPAGGHGWIEATWTRDGRTVAALVSRERSTDARPVGCVPGPAQHCWLGDIVAARSVDGGARFRPGAVVASLGDRMPRTSRRFGAFTVSNIARGRGGWFTVLYMEGEGAFRGNCLLRSGDPADPSRWRGWDGRGFTVDVRRPDRARRCAVLPNLSQPVRSISWLPRAGRWLAVLTGQVVQPDGRIAKGFVYGVSADLRRWEPPRLLMEVPLSGLDVRDPNGSYWSYPVLIDPASRSRNFDTVDHRRTVLLATVHHLKDGRGTFDRDLVAVPVAIDDAAPRLWRQEPRQRGMEHRDLARRQARAEMRGGELQRREGTAVGAAHP